MKLHGVHGVDTHIKVVRQIALPNVKKQQFTPKPKERGNL
jgi:hypothetical protein